MFPVFKTKVGDEVPGKYKLFSIMQMHGSCKIVYCNGNDYEMSKVLNLDTVEQKRCSKICTSS